MRRSSKAAVAAASKLEYAEHVHMNIQCTLCIC